ncbi:helix-turn-helix domain-containing protein [Ensifer sp. 2YAB10]|uniref:helix-turn-helix domain-containing protein n=1 Tax=unclassified Ensifer TaxID=2633371 RepID=UPI003F8E3611
MRKQPAPAQAFQSMLECLRVDHGLSYRQIAAEAGISHASVWRIAQGETSRPSYQVGFGIERAYRARRTDAG